MDQMKNFLFYFKDYEHQKDGQAKHYNQPFPIQFHNEHIWPNFCPFDFPQNLPKFLAVNSNIDHIFGKYKYYAKLRDDKLSQ